MEASGKKITKKITKTKSGNKAGNGKGGKTVKDKKKTSKAVVVEEKREKKQMASRTISSDAAARHDSEEEDEKYDDVDLAIQIEEMLAPMLVAKREIQKLMVENFFPDYEKDFLFVENPIQILKRGVTDAYYEFWFKMGNPGHLKFSAFVMPVTRGGAESIQFYNNVVLLEEYANMFLGDAGENGDDFHDLDVSVSYNDIYVAFCRTWENCFANFIGSEKAKDCLINISNKQRKQLATMHVRVCAEADAYDPPEPPKNPKSNKSSSPKPTKKKKPKPKKK